MSPRKTKMVAVNERGLVIGEDHPSAKLTDADVDEVLALHELGLGYGRIAKKFDVTKGCVQKILTGRRRCQIPARFRAVSVKQDVGVYDAGSEEIV